MNQDKAKTLFVTVGSTKFENLINTVLNRDTLKLLAAYSFKRIILQVGNGVHVDDTLFDFKQENSNFKGGPEEIVKCRKENVDIIAYRYKKSIREDVLNADLIISHAGSGSVMESLEANKKLIVVVNETLMDNHQLELAEKMFEEGYLVYTTCDGLREKIELINSSQCQLANYIKGDPSLFGKHLNKLIGC